MWCGVGYVTSFRFRLVLSILLPLVDSLLLIAIAFVSILSEGPIDRPNFRLFYFIVLESPSPLKKCQRGAEDYPEEEFRPIRQVVMSYRRSDSGIEIRLNYSVGDDPSTGSNLPHASVC